MIFQNIPYSFIESKTFVNLQPGNNYDIKKSRLEVATIILIIGILFHLFHDASPKGLLGYPLLLFSYPL